MTTVSELLAVKIELVTLKIQQAIAVHDQLVKEQTALIDEARREVTAPVGHIYHLDTKTFHPPAGPLPFSTSKARQAKRAKG